MRSAPVGGAVGDAGGFSDGQDAFPHAEFHGQGAAGRNLTLPECNVSSSQ